MDNIKLTRLYNKLQGFIKLWLFIIWWFFTMWLSRSYAVA